MTRNVGALEWKLRALAGVVLLAAAFFIEWRDAWEGPVALLGAALIATGFALYTAPAGE